MWPDPSPNPLPRKVFNHHYDRMLETGQLNPDILPYCDQRQQYALNEAKKALVRLNKKYGQTTKRESG